MSAHDGRRHVPELAALLRRDGDRFVLAAPMPGLLRDAAVPGSLLSEGMVLGELEVLGLAHRLIVPAGARGLVVASEGRRTARRPVAYGEPMLVLDPSAIEGATASAASVGATASTGALVFKAPMSGRYYAKPGPGADPFVKVGDVIESGRSVALLEVMKTFNRVQYAGATLPARAKVVAIVPKDGDDVSAGDPLLELEPA